MNIRCEHCGGKLHLRGYEQILGDAKSRRWHLVCELCGLVHEYDSSWNRICTLAGSAPKSAQTASARQTSLAAAGVAESSSVTVPSLVW